MCGISVGSCYEILTAKLKIHHVAAKFVPHLITDDQKVNRFCVCQELLDRLDEDENFLSRITSTQNVTAIRYSFRLSILQSDKRKKNTLYLKLYNLSTNEDQLIRTNLATPSGLS